MTIEQEHLKGLHDNGYAVIDCWRCEGIQRGLPLEVCGSCGHNYDLHRGGEECDGCECTWFDTIVPWRWG